jgi:hypothetical protein
MRGSLRPRTPAQGALWINNDQHTFQTFPSNDWSTFWQLPQTSQTLQHGPVLSCSVYIMSTSAYSTHVVLLLTHCILMYSAGGSAMPGPSSLKHIENRSMPVYFREQPSTATKKHLKPAKWRNVKRYQRPTCSQHVTNLCESCDKQINIHNYCISLCPSWTFCDFHSGWMKFNQHAKPIDA